MPVEKLIWQHILVKRFKYKTLGKLVSSRFSAVFPNRDARNTSVPCTPHSLSHS